MNEPIVQCKNLTKFFGNVVALDHVSFALTRGKIIGLLGPNGSGKTTWIKLANGLLQPTEGEILINGKTPGPDTKAVVSYLPDRDYFSGSMHVAELIAFFADFYNDFDTEKANQMVQELGLDPSAKFRTLSKGNREKIQLILVMSRKADLYLLDEPIGGVDPATRDYILHNIIRNFPENATIVISTHLIAEIEDILDEAILIKNGTVILHDSADSIRQRENKSIDAYFREVFRCW